MNAVFFLMDTVFVWFNNHEDNLTTRDCFTYKIKERLDDSVHRRKKPSIYFFKELKYQVRQARFTQKAY